MRDVLQTKLPLGGEVRPEEGIACSSTDGGRWSRGAGGGEEAVFANTGFNAHEPVLRFPSEVKHTGHRRFAESLGVISLPLAEQ